MNGWVAPTSLGALLRREVGTRREGGRDLEGGKWEKLARLGGRGQEEWGGAAATNQQVHSRPKVPAARVGHFRRRLQRLKNKQTNKQRRKGGRD